MFGKLKLRTIHQSTANRVASWANHVHHRISNFNNNNHLFRILVFHETEWMEMNVDQKKRRRRQQMQISFSTKRATRSDVLNSFKRTLLVCTERIWDGVQKLILWKSVSCARTHTHKQQRKSSVSPPENVSEVENCKKYCGTLKKEIDLHTREASEKKNLLSNHSSRICWWTCKYYAKILLKTMTIT